MGFPPLGDWRILNKSQGFDAQKLQTCNQPRTDGAEESLGVSAPGHGRCGDARRVFMEVQPDDVYYAPVKKLMAKQHNGRLTTPLIRKSGTLRPASWDEALHEAAQGIRAAVQKAGPQSFGMFSCSKTTNELNFLSQKFARAVIGSNNIDSCNRT